MGNREKFKQAPVEVVSGVSCRPGTDACSMGRNAFEATPFNLMEVHQIAPLSGERNQVRALHLCWQLLVEVEALTDG